MTLRIKHQDLIPSQQQGVNPMQDNFIKTAVEELVEVTSSSQEEALDIISENLGLACGLLTLNQVIRNKGEYSRVDSDGMKKLNELNEQYPFDMERAKRNHDNLIEGALMVSKLSSASDHLFIIGRALTMFQMNLTGTAKKFGYFEGFDTLISGIRQEES